MNMALKKALLNGNLALNITYWTWIWLSKSLAGQESCHQIFLLKMAFLTVKFYDYFDYAWGGGEFRIDYVICAHSVNQEPWVQGLATVSIFLLLPLQYRGKLFGGTVPPNNTLFGGTVSSNNTLFGGTVPPNSTLFGGTPDSEKWYLIQCKVLDFMNAGMQVRRYACK